MGYRLKLSESDHLLIEPTFRTYVRGYRFGDDEGGKSSNYLILPDLNYIVVRRKVIGMMTIGKQSIFNILSILLTSFQKFAGMEDQLTNIIRKAYSAFNERDIEKALSAMQPDVQWSKAWEGGYISGHDEIRQYWTRQWAEIDPHVEPVGFSDRNNGSLEVSVHQNVKDLQGNLMFDGIVKHIYSFQDGLIKTMDIELVEHD
jgi:hypothetical protein